jgi:alanyl-tRNA synthetase
MTTTRLYQHDAYLREFSAHVVERSGGGRKIYLDRTAFYPTSGGQPHDTGEIGGVRVVDVIDEDKRIAHVTSAPLEGAEVLCRLDWARRFDHMQQHTGQHLLSAVLAHLYGAETVGFHLGAESATIDLAVPALEPRQVLEAETRVNERIVENHPVSVTFEASSEARELRRTSGREGVLRIVTIEGLDRTPCGGTHVRATGEIGPLLIRKLDKIRGCVRLEFLCGGRAVRRARADYEALLRIARLFSSPLDEAPSLASAQRDALEASEKARRRLAGALARRQGQELYQATAPGPDGMRRVIRRRAAGAVDEELRALAQGFTAQPKAVFAAAIEDPPAVLFAVSEDSGLHAGEALKTALARCGGRGGGSARIAQGSVPSRDLLDTLLAGLG